VIVVPIDVMIRQPCANLQQGLPVGGHTIL